MGDLGGPWAIRVVFLPLLSDPGMTRTYRPDSEILGKQEVRSVDPALAGSHLEGVQMGAFWHFWSVRTQKLEHREDRKWTH